MRKTILKQIVSVLCISALVLGFAGCSKEEGGKMILLDGVNAGEEGKLVREFDGAISLSSKEHIYLEMFDASGVSKTVLNGKEIDAGAFTDVTHEYKKGGGNSLEITADGEGAFAGSKFVFAARPEVNVKCVNGAYHTESKEATVEITVRNLTGSAQTADMALRLTDADNNAVVLEKTVSVELPDGESVQTIEIDASDITAWCYADPCVYTADVTLSGDFGKDVYGDTVGFKELAYDENGFLLVNGKQTLLKCAEISFDETYGEDMRSALNFAKTCGYNAVIVADGALTETMLDYCDLIGVMAIGEFDYAHVSLMPSAGVDIAADISADDADAVNALKNLGVGSIVRISASALRESGTEGSALAAWYESSDAIGVIAPGEAADASGAQDVKELYRLGAMARSKDIGGMIIGGDLSMKKFSYSDVIPDILNDVRFAVNLNSYSLYKSDTLKADIVLSNFGVLRKGNYTALINIVGENGKAYGSETEFTVTKGEHMAKIASESIPLADFAPGEYKITCEMSFGAHPTCGEAYFTVYDDAPANIGASVSAAGLTSYQKEMLAKNGVAVSDFNGSQSGTVLIGPEADGAMFDKAAAKAKEGAKVIVLGADAFGTLPDGVELAKQDNVYIPENELTVGLCGAGEMPVLYECGSIFTGKALTGQFEMSALSGYFADENGEPVSVSLCARYKTGSGGMILSTLNFREKSPFTDKLLLNLIACK